MSWKYLLQKGLLFSIAFYLLGCLSGTSGSENNNQNSSAADSTLKDPLFTKYKLNNIKLPPGFSISVYAEVPGARSLCLSPDGTLFAGTRKKSVYAIPDKNKDGKADHVYKIADGLEQPNGVAYKDGDLYIGAISTIYKISDIQNHLSQPAKLEVVYDKYPTRRHHGWKFIAFGLDGKLYVPVGAPCNICEPEPIFASMTRINTDGTGFEMYVHGIRNTVGFDWDPITGDLWFTDNGRDNMGDDIPNDELNHITAKGMHFGYPYCHQGNIPDPEFGKGKSCADYTPPVKLLGPHVAALGMRFNKHDAFPEEYKNAIFIAEHGSWNRSTPIGYRMAVVKRNADNSFKDPEIFAEGWLQNLGDVSGRPVDVQFSPDGSLFVSDDYAGVIYKITYKKP